MRERGGKAAPLTLPRTRNAQEDIHQRDRPTCFVERRRCRRRDSRAVKEATMTNVETEETSTFTSRLPQTHARDVADRIAEGKTLRQRTPRNVQATWTPP